MRKKPSNNPKKGKKAKKVKKTSGSIKKKKLQEIAKLKKKQGKKSSYSYSLKKYQSLPLREKMLEKLKSSRFRYTNEQLYNMKGEEALKYFQNDREAFTAYHEGYQQQVQSWPINPVDEVIKSLTKLCSNRKDIVIGDFGCGDAKLAKSLPGVKVHSFDLVPLDPCVTACDMASTPLPDEALDIAVFCLSLMGTNFTDYLVEANRVLKTGGTLKLAEVESRFENLKKFIEQMTKFGFEIISKNLSYAVEDFRLCFDGCFAQRPETVQTKGINPGGHIPTTEMFAAGLIHLSFEGMKMGPFAVAHGALKEEKQVSKSSFPGRFSSAEPVVRKAANRREHRVSVGEKEKREAGRRKDNESGEEHKEESRAERLKK